jgi:hypothetical protein
MAHNLGKRFWYFKYDIIISIGRYDKDIDDCWNKIIHTHTHTHFSNASKALYIVVYGTK